MHLTDPIVEKLEKVEASTAPVTPAAGLATEKRKRQTELDQCLPQRRRLQSRERPVLHNPQLLRQDLMTMQKKMRKALGDEPPSLLGP